MPYSKDLVAKGIYTLQDRRESMDGLVLLLLSTENLHLEAVLRLVAYPSSAS